MKQASEVDPKSIWVLFKDMGAEAAMILRKEHFATELSVTEREPEILPNKSGCANSSKTCQSVFA
ncbi:hypothetical protein C5S36_15555 [Candidatus Methanophagaceae archaeon]|jgi:hypothetical protein|nr:hypothetical protein C5S36_15555 [Methanophagales archaeon]